MNMTDEQINRVAPSVFATEPWHERTERYNFVPTIRVVNAMRDAGFQPVKASQSNSRIEGKREFTKHMLRFRSNELNDVQVGDNIPEIVLINSHDGTSAYKMMFGIFRLVCSNGLVIAESTFSSISVRHIGESNLCNEVIRSAKKMTVKAPSILNTIEAWRKVTLNQNQRISYANEAKNAYDTTIDITPDRLLRTRRYADDGGSHTDLWRTYNTVQENIIKGGLYGRSQSGQWRHTRQVKSIDNDVKINRALWELTANTAKRLVSAPIPSVVPVLSAYERVKALVAKYGPDYMNHINEAAL